MRQKSSTQTIWRNSRYANENTNTEVNKMEKKQYFKNQSYQEEVRRPAQQKVELNAGKVCGSGISQPHNAKKEGLGPNTNR